MTNADFSLDSPLKCMPFINQYKNNSSIMNKLIPQGEFLKKYNISKENFEATGYTWKLLNEIYDDYLRQTTELENCAILIFNTIMKFKDVHSVRYRVKDPEHLIEKIIRKKIENFDEVITIGNYSTRFTDLIGVRALHLYKDRWQSIHEAILSMWDLHEPPKLNYRAGDPNFLISTFQELKCIVNEEEKSCNIKEHPRGYRSIHYIIKSKPAKRTFYIEVQTRTIFEEAFSEIDHHVTYPYDTRNIVVNEFLMILNRLAGNGDEMGSFLQILKRYMAEKEEIIETLKGKIDNMEMTPQNKDEIKRDIEHISLYKWNYDFSKLLEDIGGFKTEMRNSWSILGPSLIEAMSKGAKDAAQAQGAIKEFLGSEAMSKAAKDAAQAQGAIMKALHSEFEKAENLKKDTPESTSKEVLSGPKLTKRTPSKKTKNVVKEEPKNKPKPPKKDK